MKQFNFILSITFLSCMYYNFIHSSQTDSPRTPTSVCSTGEKRPSFTNDGSSPKKTKIIVMLSLVHPDNCTNPINNSVHPPVIPKKPVLKQQAKNNENIKNKGIAYSSFDHSKSEEDGPAKESQAY